MACKTLQGKYAEKLEKEVKRMNETIEKLYKILDALDSIIDQQALEIARLNKDLSFEKKVVKEYLAIEQRLDKARSKLESMFDNGNEDSVLEDLLELSNILGGNK